MNKCPDLNCIDTERSLSIIIPCHNEQAVIRETYRRLAQMADSLLDISTEMVFVDDGSNDGTADIIEQLSSMDSRVRLLRLSRNFGQQVAITAGMAYSTGDAVVPIDADLQDPPEVIPEMVAKWRSGYDVVYGTRLARDGEPALRLWSIKMFYRVSTRVTDTPIPPNSGDFRLLDRKVVNAVLAMPERHRFVRGMVAWAGFRQVGLPYRRDPRWAGRSKYPFRKLLALAAESIFSSSMFPLRLATWVGVGLLFLAFSLLVIGLMQGLFSQSWTVVGAIVLCVGGIQLLSIGVLGEYIGRLYDESKRRPLYFVRDMVGFRCDGEVPTPIVQHGIDERSVASADVR